MRSLSQLIDDITADAHDGDEQVSGFFQVFHDEVTIPIFATVLGVTVREDERRGLIVGCSHDSCRTWLCFPVVH